MTPHLDEHMTHYEWSGAVTAIPLKPSAGSRRDHPWHASTGILALLASLMILNGCDRQGPAERAGAQSDDPVQELKSPVTESDSAHEAGRAHKELGESTHKP